MRLRARRLYRAFPELGRYSDERCERFVRAAKGGPGRLIFHGILIGLVFLTGAFGTGLLMVVITDMMDRKVGTSWTGSMLWRIVLLLGLVLVAAIPPVGAFLTRDVLLRRRVRYVLRTRGACHSCHY